MTSLQKFKGALVAALVIGSLAALPSQAAAAPISGTLSISDFSNGVEITSTDIIWLGLFQVGVPVSGDFSGLVGTTGTELNLNSTLQPVGSTFPNVAPNTTLPGEGVVLAGFLTLTAAPNISFDLNYIAPGSFSSVDCSLAAAAGQTCTLPGTPFNFVNQTATTSSVTFALSGFVRNVSTGELSTFTGVYTTQFTESFQDVIAQLESTGFIINTYSGTFTATVTPIPEPATLLTFGAGSVFLAARKRRRAKKVQA